MADNREVTAWVFQAKDYAKALELKQRLNGIMTRETHPTLGPIYVVRRIPLPENLQ